ncbi:hypothetical protein [Dyella sp.]|uniref:hypothetical protein n=1 Tax=Dyella sp. TaxID=1869338 RepID=UPI0028481C9D|nr:hypothetical protein [Dyella sp.]MDR3446662.1 hypothetical protein [Dyella sp.]
MSVCRPIGHIAGNLAFAAIGIAMRVKHALNDAVHVCWITDDGCIYLQQAAQREARAVLRNAPDQVVTRYRKQAGFAWSDVHDDLTKARADFAAHAMAEALQA